ncbi:MAG: M24 family metallopeptidase [Patescibacteria group bacterium]
MLQQRVGFLKKKLKENDVDALLVSNFYNILYLSGFQTLVDNEREAWLLVTQKNEYLFTDERYSSQSHNIRYIKPEKRLVRHLQEVVDEEQIKTIGFESEDLKFSEYSAFNKAIKNAELVPLQNLIIKQREIKDDREIEKVRSACQIADQCLSEIVKTISIGQSEKEIAFRIEFWLKKKAYGLAFDPIVAVDANSAIPHYDTKTGDDKKINEGSIVLIDFGAKHESYLSDMTRMVFAGRPGGEMVNAYNNLLSAQKRTVEKLKIGVSLKDVDSFCRAEMDSLGLPNYSHSTGHGVGLEIHELPKISFSSDDKAIINQIITVEPGVYISGRWGMRIEDTVVIGTDGAKPLTLFDKKMLVI